MIRKLYLSNTVESNRRKALSYYCHCRRNTEKQLSDFRGKGNSISDRQHSATVNKQIKSRVMNLIVQTEIQTKRSNLKKGMIDLAVQRTRSKVNFEYAKYNRHAI